VTFGVGGHSCAEGGTQRLLEIRARAWHDAVLSSVSFRGSVKDHTKIDSESPAADETYSAPAIEWVEVMEEAGVYAACAKDPLDPLSEGCFAFPKLGTS